MDTLESIWDGISDVIPGNVVGAIIILIVGWILARLISSAIEAGLRSSGVESRIGGYLGGDDQGDTRASGVIGQIVFYLIMLFVIIAVLDLLDLQLATEPLGNMLAGIFGFLPNIIGAVLLLILAVVLAKIVRGLIFQLARSAQLDERLRAVERGETGTSTDAEAAGENAPLSRGLSEVAFVLILLLFLPAILGALQLEGLLEPVNLLLNDIFGFIPNLVAAALILVIAWFLARILARIVTNFLAGVGFDELPARLGFGDDADSSMPAGWNLSQIAGTVLLVLIMWFAVIQALEVLQFTALAVLAMSLLELAGRIILGVIIIGVGLLLARFIARVIRGSVTQQANLLAFAAQAGIILLFGAMGLRQMGVADSIINLAFGILFGAVGVAVAIAFGIGGRGAAGRLADRWVAQAESGQLDAAAEPESDDPTEPGPSTV
jgi:hypothetical protein